jgi:hypothetical protein
MKTLFKSLSLSLMLTLGFALAPVHAQQAAKQVVPIAFANGVAIYEQAAPTPGVTSAANAYRDVFNAAYYNSKPPAWQALYNGLAGARNGSVPQLSYTDHVALIKSLWGAGAKLDPFIEGGAGGVDPFTTMLMRQIAGWAYVWPGTGLDVSTDVMGMGNSAPAPAGAIATSTNINNYPPYPVPVVVPPAPVASVKNANPVGIRIMFGGGANAVGDLFRCAVPNDGYPTDLTGIWKGTTAEGYSGTWVKDSREEGMMIIWVKTQ